MFEKSIFVRSAFKLEDLIKSNLPEVILCGRSNVGKSSLINSLFNKKKLAKTSSTPGKTRSVNYYLIDDKFYLVDLPGFGYAKISKEEREYWASIVAGYLDRAKNISIAFHLIDSRHKPTELDMKLNELLKFHKLPYIVILSKVDKLNQSEISAAKKNITNFFPDVKHGDNLYVYSSVKKTGKRELLKKISKLFYI